MSSDAPNEIFRQVLSSATKTYALSDDPPVFAHGDGASSRASERRPIPTTSIRRRETSRQWASFEIFAPFQDFEGLLDVGENRSENIAIAGFIHVGHDDELGLLADDLIGHGVFGGGLVKMVEDAPMNLPIC